MTEKHLHIISFDIPFPPDYGGVVDVFYRIKALSSLGVKIHLHCFEYGREHSTVLEKLCASVHYYQRHIAIKRLFSKLPYIVATRESEKLSSALLNDNYPILMEGLHSTLLLQEENFKGRKVIVRSHNVEHDYYAQLAVVESNPFRKVFFKTEARKLKSYEAVLQKANDIAAISMKDAAYMTDKYSKGFYLPPFHPNEKVECKTGTGKYALYHGNLGVGENNHAALFLVREVFSKIDFPFIVAGHNPSAELKHAVSKVKNISLTENADTVQLQDLIKNANINILPTFQSTGIKLKLINALFNGRYCIVNELMVEKTGLEGLCIVRRNAEEMQKVIVELQYEDFTESQVNQRKIILETAFSNIKNGEDLISRIWEK